MRHGTDTIIVEQYPRQTRGAGFDLQAGPLTEFAITGCSVQPGHTTRNRFHRDGVQVQYTVFAPANPPIPDGAFVRWRGQLFQVDGTQNFGHYGHQTATLVNWREAGR